MHGSLGSAVVVLNFPGLQAAHVSVTVVMMPEYPAAQAHCVTALLPAADDEFTGHAKQFAALVAATSPEYLPSPHAVHA